MEKDSKASVSEPQVGRGTEEKVEPSPGRPLSESLLIGLTRERLF